MAYDPRKVLELDEAAGVERGSEGLLKQFALAPLRGAEGLVKSTYNLVDFVGFDVLPDYDERFLGTSSHWAPGLLEGIVQFAVPYGAFSKAAGVARLTGMKALSRGERFARRTKNYARMTAAGAAADFVAFDPNEGRLSDFLVQVPGMENALTSYLATDMEDGELEGRFKNMLEGALVGPVFDAVVSVLVKGAKASRHVVKQRATGRSDESIAKDLRGAEFDASDDLSQILEAYAGYDHRRWMLLNTLANTMGLDRTKIIADLDGKSFEELAEQAGKSVDEFAGAAKGYTIPAGTDRVILGAFKSADVTTGVHELAHAARLLLFNKDLPADARLGLDDDLIDLVGREMGAELDENTGKWTYGTDAEEKFAEAFERYIAEGIAPTKELGGVMGTLASFVREIYRGITGGAMSAEVSPEMRGVFDKLMQRGDIPDVRKNPNPERQSHGSVGQVGALSDPLFQVDEKYLEDVPANVEVDYDGRVLGKFNPERPEKAEEVKQTIVGLRESYPNPLKSPVAWKKFMAVVKGTARVPRPPKRLMRELKSGRMAERLARMTPRQIEAVNSGLELSKQVGESMRTPEDLARLLYWTQLSTRMTPYFQEGAFMDTIDGITPWIEAARRGEFNLKDYLAWADKTLPKGGDPLGAGVKSNVNAFGKTFLRKVNDAALRGEDQIGDIFDIWNNTARTDDAVADFMSKYSGYGFDTKLLNFARLVTGYDDMLVLDRIQLRQYFDLEGNDYENFADAAKGPQGIALYEGMQRALLEVGEQLYRDAGRKEPFSMARFHWETWISSRGSEVAHETLAIFVDGMEKYAKGVRETNPESVAFNVVYGPKPGDNWRLFPYTDEDAIALNREEWDDVAKVISDSSYGVVPVGFKLSKYKDSKESWHNDGQVDTEQIAILAAIRSGKLLRKDGTEGVTRDLDPDERVTLVKRYRVWRDAAKVRRLHSRLAEADGASYTRATGVTDADVRRAKLGKKVKIKAVYEPTAILKEVFGDKAKYPDWEVFGERAGDDIPMATPVFYELDLDDPDTVEQFIKIGKRNKESLGDKGATVDIKSAEELAGARAFATAGGDMVAVLKPDGDMTNLVKRAYPDPDKDTVKGVAHAAMRVLIDNGGRKGDNYDVYLSDIYAPHVEFTGRTKFNEEFVPDEFKDHFEKIGNPDIVSFVVRPIQAKPGEMGPDPYRVEGGPMAKVESYDKDGYMDMIAERDADLERQQKELEGKPGVLFQTATDRNPVMREAAQNIGKAGGLTQEGWDALVDELKPVVQYRFVPKPATNEEMAGALSSNKKGKVGAAQGLEPGHPVGLRLDIPAYRDHGVWVPTIHEGVGKPTVIGHEGAAAITGASFDVPEKAALRVAQGGAKSPFAVIKGEFDSADAKAIEAEAQAALSDPAWTQIGFDPTRHSYFYDRGDHRRVIEGAERVIQVGPLVLAKNAEFSEPRRVLFQDGPEAAPRAARDEKDLINWDKLSEKGDLNARVREFIENDPLFRGPREERDPVTIDEQRAKTADYYERLADELDVDYVDVDLISILQGDAKQLTEVTYRVRAMRDLLATISDRFMQAAGEHIDESGRFVGDDVALVNAMRERHMMHETARIVGGALSETARLLNYAKMGGQVRDNMPTGRRFDAADDVGTGATKATGTPGSIVPKVETRAEAKAVLDALGGRDAVRKMVQQDFVWKEMHPGSTVPPPTKSTGLLPALQEYWMNNILSGVTMTHAANITSGIFRGLIRPLSRAVGAAANRDIRMAKREIRELYYFIAEINDALKISWGALKSGEPVLVGQKGGVIDPREQASAISAEGFNRMRVAGLGPNLPTRMGKGTTHAGRMLDWLGAIVNIPSRMLMSQDEFFKQLNYRANIRRKIVDFAEDNGKDAAWIETQLRNVGKDGQMYTQSTLAKRAEETGRARGLEGEELAEFVNKTVAEEFNSDVAVMALGSRQTAREGTFTQDLTATAGKQKLYLEAGLDAPQGTGFRGGLNSLSATLAQKTNEYPILRFVFPFIRTPQNLMQFFLDNSIGALSDKMRVLTDKTLRQSMTPSQRADLNGRLFTAGALFTSMFALASARDENGMPLLTGAGPTDSRERKLWQSYGWQPYSFRMGDKYVSYRRLDPFSTFAGLVADMTQEKAAAEMLNRKPEMGKALFIALANNLASRSYLTGAMNVARMLNAPEESAQYILNSFASGFAPASGFVGQTVNAQLGEDYMTEVRSIYDAYMQRTPGGFSDLPVKRDVLGDPIQRAKAFPFALFGPTPYTMVKNDKISRELVRTGASIAPPDRTTNGVDWTEFQYEGKETAYDRWMELHGTVRIQGRTLRQQLERTIRSKEYQLLSLTGADEVDSPRVRVLRNIVGTYRAKAKNLVLREIPELADAVAVARYNEQALRRPGATIEDLIR